MTGPNPALRTIFFRLGRLAAMPVTIVVVLDGPLRPGIKRGKKVLSHEYEDIKHFAALVKAFGFHVHQVGEFLDSAQGLHPLIILSQAPGEAEAELAAMNRAGVVDAVLTDDSDILVFGAHSVIRKCVPYIVSAPSAH